MKKIIICVIALCFLNVYGQTTYTGFKNAFKKNQKKYTLVDKNSVHLTKALDAFHSSQNPIFKRIISKYLKENESVETYLAVGQYLENDLSYKGSELCKWILEKAENNWSENIELQYYLAYIYEKFSREYRSYDLLNRLFISDAKSIYENMIKENPNNSVAKYHLARYALEGLEEFHNSYTKQVLAPEMYKKDYDKLGFGTEKINEYGHIDMSGLKTDIEDYRIKNSVSVKMKGNASFIVKDALRILEKYKPDTFRNKYFDYSKLLIKMHFINKEFLKCIEVINQKDQSIISYKDYLMKGVCNYNLKNYKEANKDFHIAIKYMDTETKNDFTFNSFGIILDQKYGDRFCDADKKTKQQYIVAYLRIEDPLYLTNENERLLEHYYRVAYSNLFFGFDIDNRREKVKGWETDRGEIFIRYGKPNIITRLRPLGKTFKTEIWNYEDKKFAFVDKYLNNNYIFAENVGKSFRVQDIESTHEFIEKYRNQKADEYKYISNGTDVDVPYKLYQFKNSNTKKTDLYLSYSITENDSIKESFDTLSYKSGIYFLDTYTNIIESKREDLTTLNNDSPINKTACFSLRPQQINISFEVVRNNDNGVAINKGKLNVAGFKSNIFNMSDIVLASKVEINKEIENSIKRNMLKIVPLNKIEITKEDDLWLYFEIYNLEQENRLNKFSQNIEIQKIDEDGGILESFNKIGEFIGLSEKSDVEISSKYQTSRNDEQIYFKLDMSEMEIGKYKIIVSIKDENREEEISKSLIINYKN